ncbi:DUF4235 domain-containing protein [Yinghuangia seranimata]|uniref:DUF4235 domain-containing protein n=1 Tax=Yinghuangia seranimata TaxID=408067 RepID=UPI00248B1800|nr:DUF4235 domain-containing protein [Yinghuangia seranimata]MDI2129075.1 DUF4235 domain-containing protein [Yinghuangia seranimata]
MNAAKLAYKPFGLALGAGSGMLAGVLFRHVWQLVGNDGDAPEADDEESTWRAVLLAAALQGALFAAVRAAVDRGGATAVKRLTGTWPA